MMKLNYKFILISLFMCLFLFFYFKNQKNSFNYKIKIKFYGLNSTEINETFNKELSAKLADINEIKDYLLCAKNNQSLIYIKTSFLNKKLGLYLAQLKLDELLKSYNYPILSINYNNNHKKENSKTSKNEEFATYIYFNNSILSRYRISIEDLIQLINSYNLNINSNYNNNFSINSQIKDENDIKKICIPLKNKSFMETFDNIFTIKTSLLEENKEAEYNLKYKIDNQALLDYQLSPKDLLNTISANSSGLLVGNYFKNGKITRIILKNVNSNNLIYSKNLDNFFDIDTITQKEIIKDKEIKIKKR